MNIPDVAQLDLIVSVDLNHGADGAPVYQFVYGSQLYATLFGVFARFGGDNSTDAYHIETVSLKLLNYQGAVNIGFTEHALRYKDTGKETPNITFGVQGTSMMLTKEFKFPTAIKVEKGKRFQLVFNRLLYPMRNFGVSQTSNPPMQRPNAIPLTPCFDSEFHYRNGEQYYDNVLRPGMLGYDGISMEEEADKFMPSGRCHKSDVTLFY